MNTRSLKDKDLIHFAELALILAFQCAFECLIQGGFGFFIFLGGDLALFSLDFELKQFFFQGFEEHGLS